MHFKMQQRICALRLSHKIEIHPFFFLELLRIFPLQGSHAGQTGISKILFKINFDQKMKELHFSDLFRIKWNNQTSKNDAL